MFGTIHNNTTMATRIVGPRGARVCRSCGQPVRRPRASIRLPEEEILAIRQLRAAGTPLRVVAEKFNRSLTHISRIGRGLIRPEVGGPILPPAPSNCAARRWTGRPPEFGGISRQAASMSAGVVREEEGT